MQEFQVSTRVSKILIYRRCHESPRISFWITNIVLRWRRVLGEWTFAHLYLWVKQCKTELPITNSYGKQKKRNENTVSIMNDAEQPWKTLKCMKPSWRTMNTQWNTVWETMKHHRTQWTQWEHNENTIEHHEKLWKNNARLGAESLRFLDFQPSNRDLGHLGRKMCVCVWGFG